jgi:lysophospholipase L1-like esterase
MVRFSSSTSSPHAVSLTVPLVAVFSVASAVGGCARDRSGLARDPFRPEGPDLLATYVALGNSLTAGVQSAGINDSTQTEAFPVLLARRYGTPRFRIPALARPGCTPPLASLTPLAYVDGATGDECAFLVPGTTGPFHNLAVPGYRVADLLSRPQVGPGDARALQELILPPGVSAVEAMAALAPTFVTLWIGANDVLGAALAGQPALATPVDAFARDFRAVLNAIDAAGVRGAAVANLPDLTRIPALLPAPRLGGLADTLRLLGLNVTVTGCDDKAGWLVSWPALAPALAGDIVTLDCDRADPAAADRILAGPGAPVDEVQALRDRIRAFNDTIAAAVAEHGFALVDVHGAFERLGAPDRLGPIELVASLQPPALHFGPFFSLDGVHPSGFAQRTIANLFTAAIARTYAPVVSAATAPGPP